MNLAALSARIAGLRAKIAIYKLSRWSEADHPRHSAGTPDGGKFAPRDAGTIPPVPQFVTSNAAVKAANEKLAAKLRALALAGNIGEVKAWTDGLDKSHKLAAYRNALLAALGVTVPGKSAPPSKPSKPFAATDTTGDGWLHAADLSTATKMLSALGVTVLPANKQPDGSKYSDAEFLQLANQTGREISRLDKRWPGIGSVLNLSRVRPKAGAYGVCYKDTLYPDGPPVTLALAPGSSDYKSKYGRPFGVQGYVEDSPSARFASVLRHELGHSLDYMTGKANRDALKATHFEVDGKPTNTATWAQRNLSEYSKTNTSEALAEMFAHYASPNYGTGASPKLPADVEAIMENIGKRKKK